MVQDFFTEICRLLWPDADKVVFTDPVMLYLSVLAVPMVLASLARYKELGAFRLLISSGARILFAAALALALAGPVRVKEQELLDIVVALDASPSIGEQRLEVEKNLAGRILKEAESNGVTSAAAMVFAEEPKIVAKSKDVEQVISALVDAGRPGGRGTNIAAALRASYSLFAPDAGKVLALISDGNQTEGDLEEEAERAGRLGIRIFAFHPRPGTGGIKVTDITAPLHTRTSKKIEIKAKLVSTKRCRAWIGLFRGGKKVAQKTELLNRGENIVTFDVQAPSDPGIADFKVVARAKSDTHKANDVLATRVQVRPGTKVLVLHPDGSPGTNIGRIIDSMNVSMEQLPYSKFPTTLSDLADYDLVVLDRLSSSDLGEKEVGDLARYLSELAGGMLFLGGKRSKDLSLEKVDPVEKLLPIKLKRRKKKEKLSLAMLLIIDRSGSMARAGKFVAAIRAAHAAVKELKDEAKVGVILFADEPELVLPLTLAKHRDKIFSALEGLDVGGGTSIYPALGQAEKILNQVNAKVKHVLLLTDGESVSRFDQHTDLVERMVREKMTISTVALGPDADRRHLRRLAAMGKGRYYYAPTPETVPKIFTRETRTVSETGAVERKSKIEPAKRSELLQGLDLDSSPEINGLLFGEVKPAAELILETTEHEPLLAKWRYGLGQVVMFTSDCLGRWTSSWKNWPNSRSLFSRMVTLASRRNRMSSLVLDATADSGKITITVSKRGHTASLPDIRDLRLVVLDPRLHESKLQLKVLDRTTYMAKHVPEKPGPYLYRLERLEDGKVLESATARLVQAYPEELASDQDAVHVLDKACTLGQGRLSPDLEELFANKEKKESKAPVGSLLVYVALGLLVMDTAARRI